MFLTPACCHLSIVLSFRNTWPFKYKDLSRGQWQRFVERSTAGRGSYHNDCKGSSRCPEIFGNGIKSPRQVLAVKPGKANWRCVPAIKTPFPQKLPPVGLHCPFFHTLVWLQPSSWDLMVCLSGNGAVEVQMENASSPQMHLTSGSSTCTPL